MNKRIEKLEEYHNHINKCLHDNDLGNQILKRVMNADMESDSFSLTKEKTHNYREHYSFIKEICSLQEPYIRQLWITEKAMQSMIKKCATTKNPLTCLKVEDIKKGIEQNFNLIVEMFKQINTKKEARKKKRQQQN